jgi:Protein kinase domain
VALQLRDHIECDAGSAEHDEFAEWIGRRFIIGIPWHPRGNTVVMCNDLLRRMAELRTDARIYGRIDSSLVLHDSFLDVAKRMVRVEQTEAARPGGEEELRLTGDSPAANSLLTRQIGDYRILREIGRGGMGVVYEAEQISLGRRVALKVLSGELSRDRLTQERFRREARAAARLHHTNIVPVYDVGQDGDVRYYAVQFIGGGRGPDPER